jgi:hypothetical protein
VHRQSKERSWAFDVLYVSVAMTVNMTMSAQSYVTAWKAVLQTAVNDNQEVSADKLF